MSSPHLPDGSAGQVRLMLSYSDASLIYRLLYGSVPPAGVFSDHCSRCARTAERLTYLELEFTEFFTAVALHPEYWTEGHGKATHVSFSELPQEADREGER